MEVTLIHPSKGRPQKAFETSKEWISKAGIEVEYILSIDNDDPSYKSYWQYLHSERNNYILHDDNRSVVEATNRAAAVAKGDILIYLSDDFKAPDNWGNLILKEFHGIVHPMLLKVDDCLQSFNTAVLTIPILNRALYERLGYFWHPEYKSMFVDEDLYWTAKKLGALKFAPHLKFPHEHVSIGKAQDDETYRNSAKNWDQGKAVFAKRKAAGFPV